MVAPSHGRRHFINSLHSQLHLFTQSKSIAIAILLVAANNNNSFVVIAKSRGASAFVPPIGGETAVSRAPARASVAVLRMSERCDRENEAGGHRGREYTEPLRMPSEDDGADGVRRGTSDEFGDLESTIDGGQSKNGPMQEQGEEGDDGSEDHNPRRGRPGVVVFSGGTAFNSASAEMASRCVGGGDVGAGGAEDAEGSISRSNSVSSLMDLMAMESADTLLGNSNRGGGANDSVAGGIKVWHVLPVTDDGGSTAEIVRVLGGPAVGDIRSRLLRLAPGTTREARAVRRLLGHRLVSMPSPDKKEEGGEVTHETVSRMAREEWLDILDGGHESYQQSDGSDADDDENNYEHPLWKDVSAPYRSIIRAFLVHFHNQVLLTHNGVRQSQSNPPFDFTGGSVGNFFFAGARTFFGSLPAAIFLFSKVAGIPSGSRVLPAVLSQERLELGAVLKDGTRIRGQYNISHPHPKLPPSRLQRKANHQSPTPQKSNKRERSGSGSGISRHRQVVKSSLDSKDAIASMHPSPISSMHYLLHDPTWRRRNAQGKQSSKPPSSEAEQQWIDRHEISPEPNPLVLEAISNANCIVYGCGSLYTSVLPSLVLEGVGGAISRRNSPKVFLLNGWHDSETSWVEASDGGEPVARRMDATYFVRAVVDALRANGGVGDGGRPPLATDYITHILYPVGTEIAIDERALTDFCNSRRPHQQRERIAIQVRGIESIPADSCSDGTRSGGLAHHRVFDPRALVDALLDLANGRELRQN